MKQILCNLLATLALAATGFCAEPDIADAKYGPHERNVLDFWKAKSAKPAPLLIHIHGGGFISGDKSRMRNSPLIREAVGAGISVATINYRFRPTPLPEILRDCARAVQFLRSKSSEWNLDKSRVAAWGGSAGAGTSLWLAFRDDLADPGSSDPVLRESSRITCAIAESTQYTYDVLQWRDVFGDACDLLNTAEMCSFYGFKNADEAKTAAGKRLLADCDMTGLISKDDPPVYLISKAPDKPITDKNGLYHHPRHARIVLEKCRVTGVPAYAEIPAYKISPASDEPADMKQFLLRHLKVF